MATNTLKRFREEALKLGDIEMKKRLGEPLRVIQAVAVVVVELASETPPDSIDKRLKELLDEMRAAAEELRGGTEKHIAAVLTLAEMATRVWESSWEAAFVDPTLDRAKEAEILRWVLDDAGRKLREALRWIRAHAGLFEQPLARLDQLEARAAEFPLWARECLARWEMLSRPAPPLDPARIAGVQAAYSRGEHEEIKDVLTRVQSGGPWVKE
jgi:hypothetical protein